MKVRAHLRRVQIRACRKYVASGENSRSIRLLLYLSRIRTLPQVAQSDTLVITHLTLSSLF